jgi:chitin synthase
MRKMVLMVESTYSALNLLFAWFALANFYIFFVSLCFTQLLILIIDDGQVILTSSLEGSAFNIPHINVLNRIAQVRTSLVSVPANTTAQYGYIGALVACFIFGMGNRPQG